MNSSSCQSTFLLGILPQKVKIKHALLMRKTRPLCTSAKSNLGDRVLGEVEKNSFIALPGKGGHSRLLPQNTVCPNLGGLDEEFYSSGSRVGLLIRLECVQGLHSFNPTSGGLQISFSGSQGYQTVTFSLE